MQRNCIGLTLAVLLLLAGCKAPEPPATKQSAERLASTATPVKPLAGCRNCHQDMQPDPNHGFACDQCHGGNPGGHDKEAAHQGLIASPAHPDHMAQRCGGCHAQAVSDCAGSPHFTLHNEVNQTRRHFGAEEDIPDLTAIPEADASNQSLALVDDMLRRRCLRCHVYTKGDNYPLIRHGTGCASCHLQHKNGKLVSHTFLALPDDHRCLSCHYGNFVGSDYHGRYEHDFNWEYRTPYGKTPDAARPYGVEEHQLTSDVHQQRGLLCIDCHDGPSLKSGNKQAISCSTCHGWRPGQTLPSLGNLSKEADGLILTGKGDGQKHPVPALRHPAHAQYPDVSCQVCHAQWTFNDSTTHLLRTPGNDPQAWEGLTVQSSSWVEHFLDNTLPGSGETASMPDAITFEGKPGIWLQGYTKRRWEAPIIRRDRDGIIKIFRPILDLRLSARGLHGEPLFDDLRGTGDGLRPYTPHTTGKAGLLYRTRFAHLEQSPQAPQ